MPSIQKLVLCHADRAPFLVCFFSRYCIAMLQARSKSVHFRVNAQRVCSKKSPICVCPCQSESWKTGWTSSVLPRPQNTWPKLESTQGRPPCAETKIHDIITSHSAGEPRTQLGIRVHNQDHLISNLATLPPFDTIRNQINKTIVN